MHRHRDAELVCHRIVTGMGGEIGFEPGPGGRGTAFLMALATEGAASDAATGSPARPPH